MKKTLIALAALAVTGAAFAQSTVTLYGVADVSVGSVSDAVIVNTSDADPKSTGGMGLNTDDIRAIANSTLNNGSSRFGMRGTEDLGGGLKAGFNLEAGVNLASGATAGEVFDRAAFMSVSGAFGEVAAGRRLTPAFFAKAAYELTGTANYSVLSKQFGYSSAGSQAATNASGARKDGLVTYTTPNFSGLTATIGTVLEGNDGQKPMELSVIYRSGPMVIAAQTDSASNSAGAKRGSSIGGSYDLGVAKVAASYQDPAGARKGFTLGASAPVGPMTLTFDLARDTEAKDTDWLLEAKYPLSKRTFAYGIVMSDGKGDNVSNTVNKVTTVTGKTIKNATGYAVGIRHNF